MKINLPNQITIARLFLSIVFFVLLAQFSIQTEPLRVWLLDVCAAIFLIAALTDILDGYLARKHNQVTAFGRIIDPFVDKVLVCGAFTFFAGSGFAMADGRQASDVAVWMVVLILGRELLVTGIRGFSEARGENYAANVYGKMKMAFQSTTAVWILVTVAHPEGFFFGWTGFVVGRTIMVWATVIVTTLSMLSYLNSARHLLAETSRPVKTP
ncbi:MAG: CDP-diacylglycerol--glycerol-3-phosphate 3-phosphatidyltransferase [Phycisphaerae bacterium]|nr:CDP-diacylglycerol--glycerol-3-phosphate 3-phosphatidyltransferase [Phycisphaerae bacterium]